MGIGDEIIATRHALDLSSKAKRMVTILDQNGMQRTHDIWRHLPFLANMPTRNTISMVMDSSCRPYVHHERSTFERWAFKEEYRVSPGVINFTTEEVEEAAELGEYVILEPTVKGPMQLNKVWPILDWQDLVDQARDVPWVQLVYHEKQIRLKHVQVINVSSIRMWLKYVVNAMAVVTTEGGLHHAAAALGVPAVVLFSGFINPRIMGYNLIQHTNICHNMHTKPDESCGARRQCHYCERSMRAINSEEVRQALFNLSVKET